MASINMGYGKNVLPMFTMTPPVYVDVLSEAISRGGGICAPPSGLKIASSRQLC